MKTKSRVLHKKNILKSSNLSVKVYRKTSSHIPNLTANVTSNHCQGLLYNKQTRSHSWSHSTDTIKAFPKSSYNHVNLAVHQHHNHKNLQDHHLIKIPILCSKNK